MEKKHPSRTLKYTIYEFAGLIVVSGIINMKSKESAYYLFLIIFYVIYKIISVYFFANGITIGESELIISNPFFPKGKDKFYYSDIVKVNLYDRFNTSYGLSYIQIFLRRSKKVYNLQGFTDDDLFDVADDLKKKGIKTIVSG